MKVKYLSKPPFGDRLRGLLGAAISLVRIRRPGRRPPREGFGEPLNGQLARRKTIDALVRTFSPKSVIETGTYMGSTTRYFAAVGVDTYTVEVNPRYQYVSRIRLRKLDNVTLICGDSGTALRFLARLGDLERPLAYLDAHWQDRLPLREEVDCLIANWDEFLVIIDDFLVPDDQGYGYDIYNGTPLSIEMLDLPEGVMVAYPSARATNETGARRGSAFLGSGEAGCRALEVAEGNGLLTIPQRQASDGSK